MKTIIEHEVGGDGGKVGAYLEDGKLAVKVSYPLEKIVEPVASVIDGLVDKLEALIPGDQKAMAAQAKIDARAALVKALGGE